MRELAAGLEFPEGPIAMRDGSVLVVEIKSGWLTRVETDGSVHPLVEVGGGPNGAAIGPDGMVYICNNGGFTWTEIDGVTVAGSPAASYSRGSIQRVDLATGDCVTLYDECDGRPLGGPNDIVFDAHGGMYFTDPGKHRDRDVDRGEVFYARADGSHIASVVFPLETPNGIGLSPDGRELYVADTFSSRLWAWEIVEPGVVVKPPGFAPGTVIYSFPGYQLLDSFAVDEDGNIHVGTVVTGAISVVSRSGELLAQHIVPGDDWLVTNICFGGPDNSTAFITSSGRGKLFTAEWTHRGLPLNFSA